MEVSPGGGGTGDDGAGGGGTGVLAGPDGEAWAPPPRPSFQNLEYSSFSSGLRGPLSASSGRLSSGSSNPGGSSTPGASPNREESSNPGGSSRRPGGW